MSSFGALGGAVFSAAMGGMGAVVLYGGAAVLGVCNQYRALQEQDGVSVYEPKTAWGKFMMRPALTSEVIIAGATYNLGENALHFVRDVYQTGGENALGYGLKAFGWGSAALADVSLRKIVTATYSRVEGFVTEQGSRVANAFNAASLNPAVFYNVANLGFLAEIIRQSGVSIDNIPAMGLSLGAMGTNMLWRPRKLFLQLFLGSLFMRQKVQSRSRRMRILLKVLHRQKNRDKITKPHDICLPWL